MKATKHVQLIAAHPGDDKPGQRMDPAVQLFTERVKPGDPIYSAVISKIMEMKILQVEITAELMERIIDSEIYKGQDAPPPPPSAAAPIQRKPQAIRESVDAVGEVVYYMRIGNRVKIGTSTNLRRRLASLNPEELMAVERGGRTVEACRHRQFAGLRTNGEWFRLEGELAQHIKEIQEASRRR